MFRNYTPDTFIKFASLLNKILNYQIERSNDLNARVLVPIFNHKFMHTELSLFKYVNRIYNLANAHSTV